MTHCVMLHGLEQKLLLTLEQISESGGFEESNIQYHTFFLSWCSLFDCCCRSQQYIYCSVHWFFCYFSKVNQGHAECFVSHVEVLCLAHLFLQPFVFHLICMCVSFTDSSLESCPRYCTLHCSMGCPVY